MWKHTGKRGNSATRKKLVRIEVDNREHLPNMFIYAILDPSLPGKYQVRNWTFHFKPVSISYACQEPNPLFKDEPYVYMPEPMLKPYPEQCTHKGIRALMDKNVEPIVEILRRDVTEEQVWKILGNSWYISLPDNVTEG